MNLGIIGNVTKKIIEFTVKNSTTILTVSACAGVVGTAVATAKAVEEAKDIIQAHEMDEELRCEKIEQNTEGVETYRIVYYRELTPAEKFKLTWKCFLVPAFLCGSTVSCIIGMNYIHTSRNLALAAAYSMSEEAAKEFKDKVVETIGEKKTEKIENAIAQDRVDKHPVDENNVIYTGNGDQLMYDSWSDRYFRGGQNDIEKKENMLNKSCRIKREGATVNDFYELIGLPIIPPGEEFGWKYKPDTEDPDVTIHFRPTMATNGEPCIEVCFNPELLHVYI